MWTGMDTTYKVQFGIKWNIYILSFQLHKQCICMKFYWGEIVILVDQAKNENIKYSI